MAKRRKAAATGLRRGPDGGQYMLVKWYPKKKRRVQKETLFGESYHRPSLLKEFEAANKPRKARKRKKR